MSGASGATGASAVTVGPAVTGAASAIGATTATLAGTVSPDGSGSDLLVRLRHLGLRPLAHDNPARRGLGYGASAGQRPVSGLKPATTYYFQLVAQNSTGSSTGAQETFTTVAAAAPTRGLRQRQFELTTVLS